MDKSRYILRQINPINLLLTGTLMFFIYMSLSLVNEAFEFRLPPAKSPDAAIAEEGIKAAGIALPSTDDYTIISEQNLFHPDRKFVASAKEGAPVVRRPDFVLHGTMITDDATIAFLDDLKSPRTTPGRGKRQWALRLGEKLSGYTLSEVYTDGAVMVNGDDRIELAVVDQSKARVGGTGITASGTTDRPGEIKEKRADMKKKRKEQRNDEEINTEKHNNLPMDTSVWDIGE